MHVAEIMTSPVVGIEPSASIADAAKLMIGSHFSGLPVVTSGKRLVGIVTEGDFLRRAELGTTRKRSRWLEFLVTPGKQAEEYVQNYGRKVDDVMTRDLVTISSGASLEELVDLMNAKKIKRVPVVDNGTLVGIVARSDMMRALLRVVSDPAASPENDQRVAQKISQELAKQPWSSAIRVTVHQGVVELEGAIFDERARQAARVCAENVEGVKSVNDQLVWIEPMSGMYILPDAAKNA